MKDQALSSMNNDLTRFLPFLFTICSVGGGAGGQAAKDALGTDVKETVWLKTHQPGDRSLVQGLKVRPRLPPFPTSRSPLTYSITYLKLTLPSILLNTHRVMLLI